MDPSSPWDLSSVHQEKPHSFELPRNAPSLPSEFSALLLAEEVELSSLSSLPENEATDKPLTLCAWYARSREEVLLSSSSSTKKGLTLSMSKSGVVSLLELSTLVVVPSSEWDLPLPIHHE